MNFASDNWAGASEKVLAALASANGGPAPAYGDDLLTARVRARLVDLFERDLELFLVPTGTGANALALSALAPAWGGAVICHAGAHVHADEGGAAEAQAGVKFLPVDTPAGKITPDALRATLAGWPRHDANVHRVAATVLSLTNLTECGTAYTPDEMTQLCLQAQEAGLRIHLDGARFANAVAHLQVPPSALTWRAGVDILTLGATKNGCLMAEALVVFDAKLAETVARLRMRAGHLVSKQRFIAAQFDAWLEDEHWLDLAEHANAMATRLAAGIRRAGPARLAFEPAGNEVFAILPRASATRLAAAGARFHAWEGASIAPDRAPRPGETVIRLVTAFNTTPDEVDRFIAELAGSDDARTG